MQKRERSPDSDRSFDPHLVKQFMRTGEYHFSELSANSSDVQYRSDGAINRIISQNDGEETHCNACECHVPGCNQSFAHLSDFEDHYRVCHRFVCRYCQRFFATNHLLEIHLAENHDSFFSLLSRQQPMYCCLEESCKHRFMDAQSRQHHMTSCHGYPPKFHFDGRQYSRAVDMTGGPEESRDVDIVNVKRNKMVISPESSAAKVPETISFGIGGSELFHLPGS